MDKIYFLQQCHYFSDLSQDQLQKLAKKFEYFQIKSDEILFEQGDYPHFFYILIKGRLTCSLTYSTGRSFTMGLIDPIEAVGELGVFTDEPRSLTIRGLHSSELLKLSKQDFKDICHEYPSILAKISKLIIDRSIKTIKIMKNEKKRTVSFLYPLTQKIPKSFLKDILAKYIYDKSIFFIGTHKNMAEILNSIKPSEDKHIVIFMETDQLEIMEKCLEMTSHIYIVTTEDELQFQPLFEQISALISSFHDIRLELIILHSNNKILPKPQSHWLLKHEFCLYHHVYIDLEDDWQRIARFILGRAVTLILGGGAAKGLAHLGVINALAEMGVPIDAIGGSSVGAGVAACFASASNKDAFVKNIHYLKDETRKAISLANLTMPRISLFSGKAFTKALQEVFCDLCIEQLRIPFFAVSSNLTLNKQMTHRFGPIWQAIRSSSAIPGIFPPMIQDDHILVDGGLLNNLPVDTMRALIGPYHKIIASQLTYKFDSAPKYRFSPIIKFSESIFDMLNTKNSKNIYPPFFETFLNALLLGSSAHEEKNSLAADFLLKPDLSRYQRLALDQNSENDLITTGYKEAISILSNNLVVIKDVDPMVNVL